MRTYDCFLFYNELDLLELRLKTLWDVVDQFVLIEASETFSGKPKPRYFFESGERFEPWAEKILQVQLMYGPEEKDPWGREWEARERAIDGLRDAEPDDLIFLSDVDEIWRPELTHALPDSKIAAYEMFHCYYWLNTPRIPKIEWRGTRRVRKKDWPGGQYLRKSFTNLIPNGGWHFSFLGDEHSASEKLSAYSHTEYSGPEWTNPDRIRLCMKQGRDLINPEARYDPVPIDSTFPKPIIEDPARWAHLIKTVQTAP